MRGCRNRHGREFGLEGKLSDIYQGPVHQFIRGRLARILDRYLRVWASLRIDQASDSFDFLPRQLRWRIGDVSDNASFNYNIGTQLAASIADHDPNRDEQREELKKTGDCRSDGYPICQAPRLRWIGWTIGLLYVAFPLCLIGLCQFDNKRMIVSV